MLNSFSLQSSLYFIQLLNLVENTLTITCCAAVKMAGSNAENAAAAAAEELNCNCGSLGTFTYGATRHGSKGVDTF